MSDMFDEFVEFCGRMRQAGLRSITVSRELAERLHFDASDLSSANISGSLGGLTIAGVDIVVDDALERMYRDIKRTNEETYQGVKANALADGMIELEPGHFVRPSAGG